MRISSKFLLLLGLLSGIALLVLSIFTFPPAAVLAGLAWTAIAGNASAALLYGWSHVFGILEIFSKENLDKALRKAGEEVMNNTYDSPVLFNNISALNETVGLNNVEQVAKDEKDNLIITIRRLAEITGKSEQAVLEGLIFSENNKARFVNAYSLIQFDDPEHLKEVVGLYDMEENEVTLIDLMKAKGYTRDSQGYSQLFRDIKEDTHAHLDTNTNNDNTQ